MEEKQQYQKYKSKFKMQCIFELISGLCMFVGVIMFVCLRFFQINGTTDSLSLSILNETIEMVKAFSNGDAESLIYIVEICPLIIIIVALIMEIVSVIKKISGAVHPDAYALEQYDKIKKRLNGNNSRFKILSPEATLIAGILCQIIFMIIAKVMFKNSGSAGEYVLDEIVSGGKGVLFLSNGVNGLIALPLLFLIAGTGFMIYYMSINRKIKMAILHDDYDKSEN